MTKYTKIANQFCCILKDAIKRDEIELFYVHFQGRYLDDGSGWLESHCQSSIAVCWYSDEVKGVFIYFHEPYIFYIKKSYCNFLTSTLITWNVLF